MSVRTEPGIIGVGSSLIIVDRSRPRGGEKVDSVTEKQLFVRLVVPKFSLPHCLRPDIKGDVSAGTEDIAWSQLRIDAKDNGLFRFVQRRAKALRPTTNASRASTALLYADVSRTLPLLDMNLGIFSSYSGKRRQTLPARYQVFTKYIRDPGRPTAEGEKTKANMPSTSSPPPLNGASASFPSPGILLVTINRPNQRNSIPYKLHWQLHALFTWFDNEPTLNVAVITGEGDKAFCAGQDLIELGKLA